MIVTSYTAIEPLSNSLIIFDRDNTLSQDFGPMNGESDCIILPNVIDGLRLLVDFCAVLAIATNQSYIGRGQLTLQDVEEFNQKLLHILHEKGVQINFIAICPHTPWDDCLCRKPKPGMLNELIKISKVQDRDRIFFVGDKESDMKAAKKANISGLQSTSSNFVDICKKLVLQIK